MKNHINISPKGYSTTFTSIDSNTAWYLDLTGSGNETISHLNENGRITIMFLAFEGPPKIVRLFGTGNFPFQIMSASDLILDICRTSTRTRYTRI